MRWIAFLLFLAAGSDTTGAEIYRYVDERGVTVYVNRPDDVPLRHRTQVAEVDLSHVSTNSELADDLRDALEREYAERVTSPHCADAKSRTEAPFWHLLGKDPSPLFWIGLALLALLLVTPFLARRLGARWLRVLILVTPPLLGAGLVTHSLKENLQVLGEVREWSDACEQSTPKDEPALVRSVRTLRAHQMRRFQIADQLANM